ncbi:hypothetical protein TREPR_2042 [Treponema primitia ZAS-2]|uniref:Uncharacterized protein n=1 Tax=Treponema primitia (strain ATCC BAA-887 / DSM 12427 / ZAS-2) TaxID=545694 RepID=F5YJU3_TREPZ|nr:hypothetical protein [Treponema primitia]AEF86983.1 hypothetical protein TREPR_2042 [Treponema primitia ZAS-2]
MNVQGRDCGITLKTGYRELGLPYAEETIREAVSLLKEEAAIEGDGNCGAIRVSRGGTGCVVTPLSIGTAPLLFALALGRAGLPVYVSGTRVLYCHPVCLVPMESGLSFDLIQDRGAVRTLYEGCRVRGFELRVMRNEWKQASLIKLKLDIAGDMPPVPYPYLEKAAVCGGERFNEDRVSYRINGIEQKNIYGLTIAVRRAGGTQTEVWIHRVLGETGELPPLIESLEITAQLLNDHYVHCMYGAFRLSLSRLALMADETAVNAADALIGPLRYYCTGSFSAEVYNTEEGVIE